MTDLSPAERDAMRAFEANERPTGLPPQPFTLEWLVSSQLDAQVKYHSMIGRTFICQDVRSDPEADGQWKVSAFFVPHDSPMWTYVSAQRLTGPEQTGKMDGQ